MPSVQYYNHTAPFWDFVANLEERGIPQAFSAHDPSDNPNNTARGNPWTDWGTGSGFPWGPMPHRGRHGAHPHHPPPPAGPPGKVDATADSNDEDMTEAGDAADGEPRAAEDEKSGEEGPSDSPRHHGRHHGHHHHGPHGRHDPHAHGRGHHGPHRRGGGPHGRGGFGGWRGRSFHPYGGSFGPFGPLADMFSSQLFGTAGPDAAAATAGTEDFKPEVDVFDTADAFVVHVSLAGAKKEDVGVSWDVDKSELSIAGVVHRPGDEELLKTLAMGERSVGAFERKVRLGSRANPAQVEVEGITAKMEDGVLRIEVPKLDAGYVEIKKVDIQ